MRLSQYLTYCVIASRTINAASLPDANAIDVLDTRADSPLSSDVFAPEHALEKRKGGGGKGGGGGGGGGKSGGGGGGGGGRTSSSSNLGGATKAGSGPTRSYGGGYYGGGASVPYGAGKRSTGGIAPGALLGIGAVALIMPGIWLYSVYPYTLSPYRFYNRTANNDDNNNNKFKRADGKNETLPVTCLCQEFNVCGCDSNDNEQYLNDLIGNGSYAALNKTLVTVSDVNGTRTLVLNGSLPNGTTAPGGTDAAPGLTVGFSTFWVMGALLLYAVALL